MPKITICPPDPRIATPPLYEYAHDQVVESWSTCPLCVPLPETVDEELCARDQATVDRLFPKREYPPLPERADARVCTSCRRGLDI